MTEPREILRQPSRPSRSKGTQGAPLTLPPDVVAKAGKRLSQAALVYAGAYLLVYAVNRITAAASPEFLRSVARTPLHPDIWAGLFIGLAVAVFFIARSTRVDPSRLMDLGLVFQVVGAFGIDFEMAWNTTAAPTSGVSWVCPWIVVFPLLVPAAPRRALVATLAAAASTPILYHIGVSHGGLPLAADHLVHLYLANAVCAGVAVVGSHVVYGLGSDISRARRMGAYRLVQKLGEGGMGEVWMAEHRMLARPAAIKLVGTDSAAGGSTRTPTSHLHRFEREVQATAQLRSPHTVEVYDYGITEGNRFYYVMELLDGLNLEELVQQHGPVPAERCVAILRQACHSLAEAHALGLVHRDVKPANIFLCRYGLEQDFVKVLDFGLVKHAGASPDVRVTATGSFAGTPAYASPESAMGEEEAVDGRSDLYSVGCVGFWLLTGRMVFTASTPVQMAMHHATTEPEPPSRCTELPVPPELDALILDLLRKEKDARPASAQEVIARLDGIGLDRQWDVERARQWWDRHRPSRAWPERAVPPLGAAATPLVQPLDAGAG
jgi:hypothetical protein